METTLIFLESSIKRKTIKGILGEEFCIVATSGHICELEKSGDYKLGIDLKTFTPSYIVLFNKKKNIASWKNLIKEKKFRNIYLATDPDREGERIAKEIVEQLNLKEEQYKRLLFYEITPSAIKEALLKPTKLDNNLVESQISRQVLDKMIGFCISPLLHKNTKALSAGRVQSVILKMIIERELEIEEYEKKPKKYFIKGLGETQEKETIEVRKTNEEGEVITYSQQEALEIIKDLNSVLNIIKKTDEEGKIPPRNPFTTSSLLSTARDMLNFSINTTTKIAQKLYEGVLIKEKKKLVGLITYPRTDSKRVSSIFANSAYKQIEIKWGKEYCNFSPFWKNKKTKHSQNAHESIHPTFLTEPKELKTSLTKDEYRLYELIFENSLICLMSFAKVNKRKYLFNSKNNYFSYSENICKFPGFLAVNPKKYFPYFNTKAKESLKAEETQLKINKWEVVEYVSGKPLRYNESNLVKELEKLGIGRPSTYNLFGTILLKRKYARFNEKKQFIPQPLGHKANDWLQKNFPAIINQKYTASLEDELDRISQGKNDYLNFIREFWKDFSRQLKALEQNIDN